MAALVADAPASSYQPGPRFHIVGTMTPSSVDSESDGDQLSVCSIGSRIYVNSFMCDGSGKSAEGDTTAASTAGVSTAGISNGSEMQFEFCGLEPDMGPKRSDRSNRSYGMGPTMLPMLSNGSIQSNLSNLSSIGEHSVTSQKIKKIDKAHPPSLERWSDDYDMLVGLSHSFDALCGVHRRTVSFAKGPPDVWNGVSPLVPRVEAPCRVERQTSTDSPRVILELMELIVHTPRTGAEAGFLPSPPSPGSPKLEVPCTIGADFERSQAFDDTMDHTH